MACLTEGLSVSGPAGTTTWTRSSKATTPKLSAGSSRSTRCYSVACAASRRPPAMEPLRSRTTTRLAGCRSTDVVGVAAVTGPYITGVDVLSDLTVATLPHGASLELGAFYAGETRRLVLTLKLPGIAARGLVQVATLDVTHVALPDLVMHTTSVPLHVNVVPGDQAAGGSPIRRFAARRCSSARSATSARRAGCSARAAPARPRSCCGPQGRSCGPMQAFCRRPWPLTCSARPTSWTPWLTRQASTTPAQPR